MRAMVPIEYIRKKIFKLNQTEFAAIAGVTQATVSRWKAGDFKPGQEEMERIRAEAFARDIAWDDRWFFAVPEPEGAPS